VNFQICSGGGSVNCQGSFTTQVSGLTAGFSGSTQSPYPTVYTWSFGDGTGGNGQNISHTYATPGTYNVTLTTVDSAGCSSTFTSTITLGNTIPCQALFVSTVSSGAPGVVQFTNLSTPLNPATGTLLCQWNFGDGTSSAAFNPVHVYTVPGVYSVCLTITTGPVFQPLCTSIYCDSVIVTGGNPCSVNLSWQAAGLTAYFNATTPMVQPLGFTWDFGDGSTGTGANPVHTYASAGNYAVVVTMTGANGCVAIDMDSISIGTATSQQVFGTVLGNSGTIGQGPFLVVLMGFNPGTGGLVYDSTLSSVGGQYSFSNVPPGIYILRAEPLPGSGGFMSYLPTYYVHAPHWGTANTISLGQAQNPYNIVLIPVPGPGAGPASAGGTVYNGGSKGEPEADVEVLLKDFQGNILDLRYSNVSGQFDFSGIAYGTYQVYAEVPGLPTTPAMISLSAAQPVVSNISITVLSTGVVTHVPGAEAAMALGIYPNPARGSFMVDPGSTGARVMEMEMSDLSGRIVERSRYAIESLDAPFRVDAGNLEPGAYLVRMRMDDGRMLQGKLILAD
ncbi:MAG TPA: PKD domain-containing protein, partial [Bacteroidales bacterium]|nr:PKD domain-containing protein [Bacteroidales bacterium]